jgi:hypothetical protein
MPPACPGDGYAFRYRRGLPARECHRPARGIVTLFTTGAGSPRANAPGLPGGWLRFSLPTGLARGMVTLFATGAGSQRARMPPACPGDRYALRYGRRLPARECPRLARAHPGRHGSGRWWCSEKGEAPPDKPGASGRSAAGGAAVAKSVRLPRGSRSRSEGATGTPIERQALGL